MNVVCKEIKSNFKNKKIVINSQKSIKYGLHVYAYLENCAR